MKRSPRKKRRSPRKPTDKRLLREKAWDALSEAIRLEAADAQGFVRCVTCNAKRRWNRGIQAGHLISGRTNGILFDERGIFPQCMVCNVKGHGNAVEFFIFVEKLHGRDAIEEMRTNRKRPVQYTREDLENMVEQYSARASTARAKKGL